MKLPFHWDTPDQTKMPTMVLAFLLLLLLLIPSTHAMPTDMNSTEPRATWTSEPRGRGTWSILSNCIFTLIICIWTVIHDDVRIKERFDIYENPVFIKSTPFSRLFSKLQWMFYTFVSPETVILSAFSQWKKARKLQKKFCSTIGVEPGGEGDILGLQGSFFVIMGGFSSGQTQPNGPYHTILEAEFMKLIEEKGVPDSIDLRQIQDRGKADAIGKLLALIQALSLVIQCLLRKIDGLSVTLLEFHVVIQVFCAVLIYSFWWSKPQGVIETIPIEQPATRFDKPPALSKTNGENKVIDKLHVQGASPRLPTASITDYLAPDVERGVKPISVSLADPLTTSTSPTTLAVLQRPQNLSLFSWSTVVELRNRLKEWYNTPSIEKFERVQVFEHPSGVSGEFEFCLYALYGAVHSSAWNSSFPTPIEQLLWRVSCISLIISPLFLAVYGKFNITLSWLNNVIYPSVMLYIVICRLYIMIECFINLRLLPADAYQTVLWENIWPHI